MIPDSTINEQVSIAPRTIFPGFPGAVFLVLLSFISMWFFYPFASIVIEDKFLAVQIVGVSSVLFVLCLGMWFRHTQLEPLYDLQVLKLPLAASSLILFVAVVIIFLGEVLIGLFTLSPVSHFFESLRFYSPNYDFHTDIRIIHIIMVVFIAPFLEELVWRGFILQGFLTRYSVPRAIIINVILFVALHGFGGQTPSQILVCTLLGIIFASTRSVLLCFALHGLHNFFLVAMDYVGKTEGTISLLSSISKTITTKSFGSLEYWIATTGGILFLGVGFHLLRVQSFRYKSQIVA